LRVLSGRLKAVLVATLATVVLVGVLAPAATLATDPPGLSRFMYAMGQVESHGNYYARNASSGAYGKYQIMPSNWPSWAARYLGNARARQTPANQEKVAAGKFTSLYKSLGSWKRAAYWWLTGSKRKTGWNSYTTRYVNRIMRLYKRAGGVNFNGGGGRSGPAVKRYSESTKLASYHGTWKTAKHSAYAGDAVRYATKAGASVTFEFTGKRVRVYGPLGPTRGKAKVYVDGAYRKTINLNRGGFDARAKVFELGWKASGAHSVRIVVQGTKGHPMGRPPRGRPAGGSPSGSPAPRSRRGSPRPGRSRRPSRGSVARSGRTRDRPCSSRRTR
jgi:Transglycosylase SLT domain